MLQRSGRVSLRRDIFHYCTCWPHETTWTSFRSVSYFRNVRSRFSSTAFPFNFNLCISIIILNIFAYSAAPLYYPKKIAFRRSHTLKLECSTYELCHFDISVLILILIFFITNGNFFIRHFAGHPHLGLVKLRLCVELNKLFTQVTDWAISISSKNNDSSVYRFCLPKLCILRRCYTCMSGWPYENMQRRYRGGPLHGY